MKKTECPICLGLIYRVDLSDLVCEDHQDWLVTVCDYCKRPCFSDCCGCCFECYPDRQQRTYVGKKDVRAPLRAYGLEHWE